MGRDELEQKIRDVMGEYWAMNPPAAPANVEFRVYSFAYPCAGGGVTLDTEIDLWEEL
jgi:hypothetical protein